MKNPKPLFESRSPKKRGCGLKRFFVEKLEMIARKNYLSENKNDGLKMIREKFNNHSLKIIFVKTGKYSEFIK